MSSVGLDLFGALGGNELWNEARTLVYMANGVRPSSWSPPQCDPCPTLADIVPCAEPPEGGYTNPEDDLAPWYDATRPESADFAGLMVTDATLSAAASRSVTDNVGHGSTLGRLRLKGRTITVEGWLVGRTCCAVAYGLRWLTAALVGSPCSTGSECGTDTFDTVSCCPCEPVGEEDPLDFAPYKRTLYGVGVVDGPNVTERRAFGGGGCGGSVCGCSEVMKVDFVLQSGQPWLYHDREAVLEDASPEACAEAVGCEVEWVLTTERCLDECSTGVDCLDDPTCTDTAVPPSLPLPINPCVCVPMAKRRVGVNVIAAADWFDSTATVEVRTRKRDLRNLVVRMWQNPLGVDWDDPDMFPDCAACSSLYVTYIGENSVLRVDGETRRITITCGTVERDASGSIYTQSGEPFGWLDMTCTDYVVAVDFDCDYTGDDATATIYVAGREV